MPAVSRHMVVFVLAQAAKTSWEGNVYHGCKEADRGSS
jgi:hypothetical protein